MRKLWSLLIGLVFLMSATAVSRAETLLLADGTSVSGEIILPGTADGLNLRIASGQYQKVAWTQFSQAALQQLAQNPRLAPFIEGLIEIPEEERLKRTEVVIQPVPRLERPADPSILGGLFSSSVGLVALLLIYVANLYAAYEISIIRAYPAVMVCGVAAVAPFVGPAIFLCLPTRVASAAAAAEVEPPVEPQIAYEPAAAPAPGHAAPHAPVAGVGQAPAPAATSLPAPQVFKRGQFTFNRRFIETKFASFFGIARREADKDMILVVKSARGVYDATRITRITGNEMHVEVRKGGATQEVSVPFTEIQELVLKHKDT